MNRKRILAWLLTLAMVVTMLPATVFADDLTSGAYTATLTSSIGMFHFDNPVNMEIEGDTVTMHIQGQSDMPARYDRMYIGHYADYDDDTERDAVGVDGVLNESGILFNVSFSKDLLDQNIYYVLHYQPDYKNASYANTWYKASSGNEYYFTVSELTPVQSQEEEADYSAVDSAISAYEALDPTAYTEESFAVATDAVNAVVRGKPASEQEVVDAMAEAINTAIAGLVIADEPQEPVSLEIVNNVSMFKLASAVLKQDGSVDLTMGSDSFLKAYVGNGASVVEENVIELSGENVFALGILSEGENTIAFYSKKSQKWFNRQVVLNTADKTLTFNDMKADYTAVDEAKSRIPELSYYTEDSAKAVQDALAAIEENLNSAQQGDVDKMAEDLNAAIDALVKLPVSLEDGVYSLPDISTPSGDMFNHFEKGSAYLIVENDTATVRFITDASTASIQKYSRIALGKSSELVETPYQPELAEGVTIIDGILQPYNEGTSKNKYLFEIPLAREEVETMLSNEEADKLYITIWNNKGASSNNYVPGWYKAKDDQYISLGTLGEQAEAPENAEAFRFTLQVGQYTEGTDFHYANLEGVEYALKDENGNLYEPSTVTSGMLTYSNLDASNTYTFTATKEGWTVVKQGEWNVDAHAYEYIFTGSDEIKATITSEYADKNVSDHTHPGMIFRVKPREINAVDEALATVPANLTLFTDATAEAVENAVAAADPTEADADKLAEMAEAINTAVQNLIPNDGEYSIEFTKGNKTPYYAYGDSVVIDPGTGKQDEKLGKTVLSVKDGIMTANLVLKNQSYNYMYLGTADEAIEAATAAGDYPEGVIPVEARDEKVDYLGSAVDTSGAEATIAGLQTDIAFSFHSGKKAYNDGWYNQGVKFIASSLVSLNEEPEAPITNLSIYNEEMMFRVVNAFIEKSADKTELVIALNGKGYEYLIPGTYYEALAAGPDKTNWIKFSPADVECIYETADGIQNEGTLSKYQFRIPIQLNESGTTQVPFVAVSKSKAEAAEKADKDNPDYTEAFYARQALVNFSEKTIRTGNYKATVPATVVSEITSFAVENYGTLYTSGIPTSNEFTYAPTIVMKDNTYDKAYLGTAEEAAASDEEFIALGENNSFKLEFFNTLNGKQHIVDNKATAAFHVSETADSPRAGDWVEREFTFDFYNNTITINGVEITIPLADYSGVDAAVAKIPEDTSIYTDESVKALKNAENAVVKGKLATEQAEVDAMAKAIEEAVAALEEKHVQDVEVTTKAASVNYADLAKADKTFNLITVKGNEGKLSFSKVKVLDSYGSKFSVDANTGKITVARYTPAGTYKVIVKVKAAETGSCKAYSKNYSVKVVVNKAEQNINVSMAANSKTLTYKTSAQTVKFFNYKSVTGNKGDITYSIAKSKYFSINKNTGVITVAKSTPVNTYKLTIYAKAAAKGSYKACQKSMKVTLKVNKANQSLKVTRTNKKVSFTNLKKKALTVKNAIKVTGAKGTVKYSKLSNGSSSYLTIDPSTGAITVKKGTRKGTFTIKVRVTSQATKCYNSAKEDVTVEVTVG